MGRIIINHHKPTGVLKTAQLGRNDSWSDPSDSLTPFRLDPLLRRKWAATHTMTKPKTPMPQEIEQRRTGQWIITHWPGWKSYRKMQLIVKICSNFSSLSSFIASTWRLPGQLPATSGLGLCFWPIFAGSEIPELTGALMGISSLNGSKWWIFQQALCDYQRAHLIWIDLTSNSPQIRIGSSSHNISWVSHSLNILY